jgi:hypothetical protein
LVKVPLAVVDTCLLDEDEAGPRDTEVLAQSQNGGENLVGSFVGIAVTIAEFGDDEASATLQGAADALSPAPLAAMAEVRVWMLDGLSQRLGDDRLTELLARIGAMTDDDAVAYAHARLDAVEASWPKDDAENWPG